VYEGDMELLQVAVCEDEYEIVLEEVRVGENDVVNEKDADRDDGVYVGENV
jgi:hypothetical protein